MAEDDCKYCDGAGEVEAKTTYGDDFIPCPACIGAALKERAEKAEAALVEARQALEVAWGLSTWAGCINWRARDKDNTGEWLDELREKIDATQSAVRKIRKTHCHQGDEQPATT